MNESDKRRYAIVGASHRSLRLFLEPMRSSYRNVAEIVALVDIYLQRVAMMNQAA